jgi:hypothetical protein
VAYRGLLPADHEIDVLAFYLVMAREGFPVLGVHILPDFLHEALCLGLTGSVRDDLQRI